MQEPSFSPLSDPAIEAAKGPIFPSFPLLHSLERNIWEGGGSVIGLGFGKE